MSLKQRRTEKVLLLDLEDLIKGEYILCTLPLSFKNSFELRYFKIGLLSRITKPKGYKDEPNIKL